MKNNFSLRKNIFTFEEENLYTIVYFIYNDSHNRKTSIGTN